MPPFLQELLTQMKGIWSRLDGGQKLTIGSVTLAALVGLGALLWVAGQPDYEVVHSSNDQRSVDDAINALQSAGLAYKPNGGQIMVDRSDIGAARTALLRAGVQGDGSSRSDNDIASSVTQDSDTRRDNLLTRRNHRAEDAVSQIEGVLTVTVVSSRPKRAAYTSLDNEGKPRASVLIRIRRGYSFVPIAKAAIRQVAAAIGVPESYVTAVDATTTKTVTIDDDSEAGVGGDQFLDQQRRRSQHLTQIAQEWLDMLYAGKALVTVSVDLDPAYESSEEKIQPTKPAIISEELRKDSTKSSSGTPSGDPSLASSGTRSRGPSGPETKKDSTNKTYEPFAGTRRRGKLTPDIRRMTIALILDEEIGGDDTKRAKIEAAIKSSVGFMEKRPSGLNDSLETLLEKFPEVDLEAELAAASAASSDWVNLAREFGPLGGQVFGVLVVVLFLRRLLKKATPAKSAEDEDDREPVKPTAEKDLDELSPDDRRRRLRRDIERSIKSDPGAMSRMLESWLSESA